MEIREYKNIFKNESVHFYYTSLHNLVISLIEKHSRINDKSQVSILDAGCGTGLLAKKLKKFGDIQGIDINNEALKYANKRGIRVKKASVTNLPFKSNTFDLITSMDVIYHEKVKSDTLALKEFYRVLKPNGLLILRVSALPWLKTSHDKFVHSKRRYEKNDLKNKIESSGLKVERISYINFLLLFPAIIASVWERISPSKNHSYIKTPPLLLNKLLNFLSSIENVLAKTTNIPIGLGIIAVARK